MLEKFSKLLREAIILLFLTSRDKSKIERTKDYSEHKSKATYNEVIKELKKNNIIDDNKVYTTFGIEIRDFILDIYDELELKPYFEALADITPPDYRLKTMKALINLAKFQFGGGSYRKDLLDKAQLKKLSNLPFLSEELLRYEYNHQFKSTRFSQWKNKILEKFIKEIIEEKNIGPFAPRQEYEPGIYYDFTELGKLLILKINKFHNDMVYGFTGQVTHPVYKIVGEKLEKLINQHGKIKNAQFIEASGLHLAGFVEEHLNKDLVAPKIFDICRLSSFLLDEEVTWLLINRREDSIYINVSKNDNIVYFHFLNNCSENIKSLIDWNINCRVKVTSLWYVTMPNPLEIFFDNHIINEKGTIENYNIGIRLLANWVEVLFDYFNNILEDGLNEDIILIFSGKKKSGIFCNLNMLSSNKMIEYIKKIKLDEINSVQNEKRIPVEYIQPPYFVSIIQDINVTSIFNSSELNIFKNLFVNTLKEIEKLI